MRRRLTISSGVAAALTIGAFVANGAVAQGTSPQPKIDVCHRTGSQTKPYVLLQVSPDKLAGEHEFHRTHNGPTGPIAQGEWGDIIPPHEGFSSGMNWNTAGQAILAARCDVAKAQIFSVDDQSTTTTVTVAPTPTTVAPTPTTAAPTTTTVAPTTTTTAPPSLIIIYES